MFYLSNSLHTVQLILPTVYIIIKLLYTIINLVLEPVYSLFFI